MKIKFICVLAISLLFNFFYTSSALADDGYTIPPNGGLKLTLDQLPAGNYGVYCSVINNTSPTQSIGTYLTTNVTNAKYFVNFQETTGMGYLSSLLNTVVFKNLNMTSGSAGKYIMIQNTSSTYPFYVAYCYASQE